MCVLFSRWKTPQWRWWSEHRDHLAARSILNWWDASPVQLLAHFALLGLSGMHILECLKSSVHLS
uniref:Uncharacterized protein n=1 Tax=Arundo donax TaxID=35708 RepID=A0A0A9D7K0_ARUDO